MAPDDDRKATVLRRTLSAISWIYALWTGLVWLVAMSARGSPALTVDPRLILLHAALLGLAGTMQWRPLRGSLVFTGLAAAGSISFVFLDLRLGNVRAAVVDGSYVVVAAALLYNSRRQA